MANNKSTLDRLREKSKLLTVTLTDVPRWEGETVVIRELSVREVEGFQEATKDKSQLEVSAVLLSLAMHDPKLSSADLMLLFDGSPEPLNYIGTEIQKLNHLTPDEVKKVEASFPDKATE